MFFSLIESIGLKSVVSNLHCAAMFCVFVHWWKKYSKASTKKCPFYLWMRKVLPCKRRRYITVKWQSSPRMSQHERRSKWTGALGVWNLWYSCILGSNISIQSSILCTWPVWNKQECPYDDPVIPLYIKKNILNRCVFIKNLKPSIGQGRRKDCPNQPLSLNMMTYNIA